MIVELALFAAASAAPPQPERRSDVGARASGRVAVQILSGARIAAGETQQAGLPNLSDSLVRLPSGEVSAARLVEFH